MASYVKDILDDISLKYPDHKIYVISDHHFYHSNIIKYGRVEFDDVSEMHDKIISTHNATVNPDDIVIFLGDFSFRKNAIKELNSKLNGHKYLILGNHDNPDIMRQYRNYGFERIYSVPVRLGDDYLSHEPINTDERSDVHFKVLLKEFSKGTGTNYHGHIHTTSEGNDRFRNVCLEAQDYKPLFIGYTKGKVVTSDNPLLVEHEEFFEFLKLVSQEKTIDQDLLLADYIYSMMLDANSMYAGSCFVYGSFSLYKKYGLVSNFSDIDIGLIQDDSQSKICNSRRLKNVIDTVYLSLLQIHGMNLSFLKRIAHLAIFEAKYSNGYGVAAKCFMDLNLVPYNLYKPTDFITSHDKTTLEKLLTKIDPSLASKYRMPEFTCQYLNGYGDMSNLVLQILFQEGFQDKKAEALRKLKYVYQKQKDNNSITELDDMMTRIFLRNLLFFDTVRRDKDIASLSLRDDTLSRLCLKLPPALSSQLEYIFRDPNSLFNEMYSNVMKTPKLEASAAKEYIKRT